MYPPFIAALDDLINSRPPFDRLDDRTLADIGVDRRGRPVNPDDRRGQPIVTGGRSKDWIPAFITIGLFATWER